MRYLATLLIFSMSLGLVYANEISGKIVGDFSIDMFSEDDIVGDIEIEDGTFTLEANADIEDYNLTISTGSLITEGNNTLKDVYINSGDKLILDSNTSINLVKGDVIDADIGSNVDINKLELDTEILRVDANADIGHLISTVSGDTYFNGNSNILKANLRTNNFTLDANCDIEEGTVYVYGDLNGGANCDFFGKMTVYNNVYLGANNDFSGRYCTLGKTQMGANTDILTYNSNGLFGNIDPLLDYKLNDSSKDFKSAKSISKTFDGFFDNDFNELLSYNSNISFTKAELVKHNVGSDEYNKYKGTLDFYVSQKKSYKSIFRSKVESTFNSLNKYIDTNQDTLNLYYKVRDMYLYAVELENKGIIYQICNNSEIVGDANSTFIKGGYIHYDGNKILRENKIPEKYVSDLSKQISNMSDLQKFTIEVRINNAVVYLMTKGNSDSTVNALFDLKLLLKDNYLY